MRKGIIALGLLAVLAVGSYWYTRTARRVTLPQPDTQHAKSPGDAEECDLIEPLLVERIIAGPTAAPAAGDASPMPRVSWTRAVTQPPRPDGVTLRMPYADEDEILGLPLDPIQRILDAARLDIFDQLDFEENEAADPVELYCPHTAGPAGPRVWPH